MTPTVRKLSATSLATFLKSPRQFYWRYIADLVPIQLSVVTYDHDKVLGSLWSEFVDRFYKEIGERENVAQTLAQWHEQTDGWVPEKAKDRLTKALETLMPSYYQTFSPKDGCRTPEQSELWLENERFVAKLDGLSEDRIVHEVKSTSRAQSVSDQLWKVQQSIQVKLYCVLAEARGYCVEFAYKDSPHTLFRGPVVEVTRDQRRVWEQQLNALADSIYALGDDPNHYPCHPDGCCITSKFSNSICPYQLLCSDNLTEITSIFYKKRERHHERTR